MTRPSSSPSSVTIRSRRDEPPAAAVSDLLALTAELVDIPSVSHQESALADRIEAGLREAGHLAVDRYGDTVLARTTLGRTRRLLLAGHLDTVPPFGDPGHRIRGDTLSGLGAVDMKGGLAVLLDLARTVTAPPVDATYLFYTCEEVDRRHNGLHHLVSERPAVLAADAAVLAEPTGGLVEAGCQGTMRVEVTLVGRRAHTARPWAGVNAIHRLAPVLHLLEHYRPRSRRSRRLRIHRAASGRSHRRRRGRQRGPRPGGDYHQLPLRPHRDIAAAESELRGLLAGALDDAAGDSLVVVDAVAGALPGLDHPLLAELVGASGQPPRAKLGWTDVATMAAAGVPAANLGPGDPLLAHTPDENVSGAELTAVHDALLRVLSAGTSRAGAGR